MQEYSDSSEQVDESDFEEDSLPQLAKRRLHLNRRNGGNTQPQAASSSTYVESISTRLRTRKQTEQPTEANTGWSSVGPRKHVEEAEDSLTSDQDSVGAVVRADQGASIFEPNVEHILYQRKDGHILVKLKGRSYLDCEWLPVEAALKRGKQVKSKYAKFLQNFDPLLAQTVDEDTEFFKSQYKQVDKILSAVEIFPIVHPKKANEVKGKWSEYLTLVCSRMLNAVAGKIKLGLYVSQPLDRIQLVLPPGVEVPWTASLPDYPIADLGTISNRLYLDCYKSSDEFWKDLGVLLQSICKFSSPVSPGASASDLNIIFETLHGLAQSLYHEFYSLQMGKYDAFMEFEREKRRKLEQEARSWQNNCISVLQNPDQLHLLEGVLLEGRVYLGGHPEETARKVIEEATKCCRLSNPREIREKIIKAIKDSVQKGIEKGLSINGGLVRFERDEDLLKFSPGNYSLKWLFSDSQVMMQVPETLVLRKSRENAPNRLLTDEEILGPHMDPKYAETIYLVKWTGVSYLDCTWESDKTLDPDKIRDYRACSRSVERDTRQLSLESHQAHLALAEAKNNPKKKQRLTHGMERQYRQLLYMAEYRPEAFTYNLKNLQQYKNKRLLRPYQIESLNWLIQSWTENRNVILADEMGLGKTIQTMAFLMHLTSLAVKMRGPFLIIAPLSTLAHWKRTVDEWSTMNGVLYYDHSGAAGRQKCRELEFHTTDISLRGVANQNQSLFKFQVLITSFEIFLQDLESVMFNIPFQHIVVDEAHRLKNNQSRLISALRRLPCERVLLLTGTPVQNNTKELWTLLDFLHPGRFGTVESFSNEFGTLETADKMQKLQAVLQPYLLRRMKEDVEKGIPPLKETIVEVEMTADQKRFYQAVYEGNKAVLTRLTSHGTAIVNNLEMQLRKVCDHPWLIDGVREQMLDGITEDRDPEEKFTNATGHSSMLSTASISPMNSRRSVILSKMLGCSGKLVLLEKLLEKAISENRKMLIFSQFTRMLALIEEFLTLKGLRYELIDGGTKSSERQYSIDRFNGCGIEIPVFLLSTKAGGVGINLTSANIVVIFDSDWNPQNDVQATARAHRIGQESEVQVYRFVANKTYEAVMFERASKKLGLDKAIFLSGEFKSKEGKQDDDKKPSKEEMEILLKKGILGFLENPVDQPSQAAQDIETILAQSKVAQYSLGGGYTFGKSTFVNDQADKDLQLDDPNFWERALKNSVSQCEKLLTEFDTKEKAGTLNTTEAQRSFMVSVASAVQKVLDSKLRNEGYSVDDEWNLSKLLGKISTSAFHTVLKSVAEDMIEDLKTGKKRRKFIDVAKLNLDSDASFGRKGPSISAAVYSEGIFESDSDDSASPKKKKSKMKKNNPQPAGNDEGVNLIIQEIKGARQEIEKQSKREEKLNLKKAREEERLKEKQALALSKEQLRLQKMDQKKKADKPKKDPDAPKNLTVMQAFEGKAGAKTAEEQTSAKDSLKAIPIVVIPKTPEPKAQSAIVDEQPGSSAAEEKPKGGQKKKNSKQEEKTSKAESKPAKAEEKPTKAEEVQSKKKKKEKEPKSKGGGGTEEKGVLKFMTAGESGVSKIVGESN